MDNNLFERVCAIIANTWDVLPEKVEQNTHFINDLGANSLDLVELVMELESEFDVTIPDEVYEQLNTVGDVIEYIWLITNSKMQPIYDKDHDNVF